jgi:hypothetical protein
MDGLTQVQQKARELRRGDSAFEDRLLYADSISTADLGGATETASALGGVSADVIGHDDQAPIRHFVRNGI